MTQPKFDQNIHYPETTSHANIGSPLKEAQTNTTRSTKSDDSPQSEQRRESEANYKKYELEQVCKYL
jgi:hypothetical protein